MGGAYLSWSDLGGVNFLAHPVELGGPGAVLQIDESCLSHKQKYHCGRVAENQIWVCGIVDTSYTPSRGYVEIVERRNAATLFPIIQSVCLDGSIIHSDEWKAYQKIQSELGLEHHTVTQFCST